MTNHQQASRITSFFIFFIAVSAIGLVIERYQSFLLISAYFTAFFCYVWIVRLERNFKLMMGLGILTRLILFFDLPHLSDDVFRFLWDGKLISMGINPFQYRPEELVDQMDPQLYALLNSQTHYTVYPPLNQAVFWLASIIGNENYLAGTNVIRFFLLMGDIGSVFLLSKLSSVTVRSEKIIWWYFLNPLVILEFVGNTHFEGLVIFFLLLMFYALSKSRFLSGGMALGLAAATKLLPLIFIPFLTLRYLWKKGLIMAIAAGLTFILIIYPLFDLMSIKGFQDSLMLYSNKFEFNASLYYVIREIGWILKGYNPIETWGPLLSLTTFLMILGYSAKAALKKENLYVSLLWVLMIYLLMATTVHPWYIITLIPLGLLSGYYFPIIWSLVVFLSYLGYEKEGFELSMAWIVVEYVVVFAAIVVEIAIKSRKSTYEQ